MKDFLHTLHNKSISQEQDELPDDDVWNIEQLEVLQLLKKVNGNLIETETLSEYTDGSIYNGIKTAFNEAFVINENTKTNLVTATPSCVQFIKPFLRGKDIKKNAISDSHLFVIYIPSGWTNRNRGEEEPLPYFSKNFPAIYAHLKTYELQLKSRKDQGNYWWELRPCVFEADFLKTKIVYPDIANECDFALDHNGYYPDMTTFFIPLNDLYLIGVLNSTISYFFFSKKSAEVRGGYLRFKKQYTEKLPIRIPSEKQRSEVVRKVQEVMERKAKGKDTAFLELEIDKLVYQIYGLTDEEIRRLEENIR